MARHARHRWKGWRVDANGTSIRSRPAALAERPWWWVHKKGDAPCSECGRDIPTGQVVAFCHIGKRVVCDGCVEVMKLKPGMSKSVADLL